MEEVDIVDRSECLDDLMIVGTRACQSQTNSNTRMGVGGQPYCNVGKTVTHAICVGRSLRCFSSCTQVEYDASRRGIRRSSQAGRRTDSDPGAPPMLFGSWVVMDKKLVHSPASGSRRETLLITPSAKLV